MGLYPEAVITHEHSVGIRQLEQSLRRVAGQSIKLERLAAGLAADAVHVGNTRVAAADVLPAAEVFAALVHVVDLQPQVREQFLLETDDVLIGVWILE